MQFSLMGSGSRGNGTLVRSAHTCIMIDCGFTVRESETRLAKLGQAPEDIHAIIVTHEHSDHIKGVGAFARKYKTPVYMTKGAYEAREYGQLSALTMVKANQQFTIGDLQVTPVAVPHDAREPVQYVINDAANKGRKRLGVLTDLGLITPSVEAMYSDCDALVIECNHDLDMLALGPYPYALKQRVASHLGHLNNVQTCNFLQRIDQGKWQHVVAAHLSEQNNTLAKVLQTFEATYLAKGVNEIKQLVVASQDRGLDWLTVD